MKPVPDTRPKGNPDDDDDDKPWTLTFTPNVGVGGAAPMWTGRSGTGTKLTPDTLELDQKTEFDLSLLTGWALGDGKIKLTVGAEYDVPLDKGHRGASFGVRSAINLPSSVTSRCRPTTSSRMTMSRSVRS